MTQPARQRYAEAARALLRESVMTAVNDLVREQGWAATTMADVAAAAGVSRQTLYNEFGSRQALVETYIAGEVQVLLEQASAAVREHRDDPHRAVETAFGLFLKLASDEPVVQAVAGNDSGEVIRLLTSIAQPMGTAVIAQLIGEVWPQAPAADALLVAETLVRLAISYALFQPDQGDTATDVARLLHPFIDQALGLGR